MLQRYFCEWWIMDDFSCQDTDDLKHFQLGVERQNWDAGRNTVVSFLNTRAERKALFQRKAGKEALGIRGQGQRGAQHSRKLRLHVSTPDEQGVPREEGHGLHPGSYPCGFVPRESYIAAQLLQHSTELQ